MNLKKQNFLYYIFLFLSLIFVSILSSFTVELYTNGDQLHYSKFYDDVQGSDFIKIFALSKIIIDSLEPGYPLIGWISSGIVNHNIFIIISNAILVIGFFGAIKKYDVHSGLAFFIATTNFYFYVLYFSAERLKFAFIFIFFSIIYSKKFNKFLLFSISAILTHAQLILMFFGFILLKLKPDLSNLKNAVKSILVLLLGSLISFILWEHILRKIEYYSDAPIELSDLLKISIFSIMSYAYSKRDNFVWLLFLPLFIATCFLGGGRIVIMGFFIFLYYGLKFHRGLNAGVILISLYFAIKSIDFFSNVLTYGDAFYTK